MNETLTALGRGIVKVMVSFFVGTGIGLVTFGASTRHRPDIWEMRNPPGEVFLSVGVGLLATGFVMAGAFILPRIAAGRPVESTKPVPINEWAS